MLLLLHTAVHIFFITVHHRTLFGTCKTVLTHKKKINKVPTIGLKEHIP